MQRSEGVSAWMTTRAVCLMLLAGAFSACRETQPVEIGVVLGSEGGWGAARAAERVNASGGVGRRQVTIRNVLGAANAGAEIAIQVAESLADNPRVMAVVGHANSSASLAGSQVYNQKRVVQIAPTTTSPLFSQAGPWSFRLAPSDQHQAAFLADVVRAERRARVALVYVNDDYGRGLRQLVVDALARDSVQLVYEGSYLENDRANGPDELVPAMSRTHPDLLLWFGRSAAFRQVGGALRASLPRLGVVASDGFGGSAVDGDTSGVFDGVRYVRMVDVSRKDPEFQRVRDAYRSTQGHEIPDQTALAYDAVLLIAAAINDVGADREKIREWLSAVGTTRPAFNGITGPIAFLNGGDPKPHYYLVTARAERTAPPRR